MNRKKLIGNMVRYSLYALVAAFFIWAISNNYFDYIFTQSETFLVLLRQHIVLVLVSSLLAILIAVPAGILITRPKFKKAEWLVSNVVNLGQTIPSLAVLALMISILGIGFQTAVFALFIYSILPIFRNTVAGIDSIDKNMIDAAKGMGMKPHQILFRIELPNSAYSILAGIRTAVVLNIGTAALAYVVGAGGLGVWIFTGINLFDNGFLISGAIPVTLLAILADYILRKVEYVVVPKGSRRIEKA
ncbi:ABC-type glycine betaine/proline transport system, inner membrane permease protein [Planococcus antarcticus DSM 14505]|uniref:ABC transporter permease n=1 Tax=Planococcus antarcticus DSM 14505 TaxID=1185653 RepID=A0A1C7DDN9_9BACL|nr:ABC transporter permease [Planococcus antarcticus]ANU09640.1 ABC transporter permease [Planococcus antarcticus DSM 14505]EIM05347.1 ABC-type glycine betaine/proline transport system, inner membrane permease protein [Planococcus antarcticus DSM 14505]